MMDRPALLCFDGSEHAAEAIRGAGALFPGQEALVLSVATPAKDELPLDPVSDLVGRLSGLYRDWDEAIADLAERQARRGCELATAAGFRPRPFSTVGTPTATILRVADQHDAAVIVLGAGKRGPLGGLLGSVVARIVHEADRPVLVIPSPPKRR
jgi:nucleotide-binding universal stress UspA family protein